MAPPSLSAKPKKAPVKSQVTCSSRHSADFVVWVGCGWPCVTPLCFFIQKSSKELLLNSLLGHTVSSTAKPSMARQRIMEEERERAVEAYRQLKKRKLQQQEARTASVGENWKTLSDLKRFPTPALSYITDCNFSTGRQLVLCNRAIRRTRHTFASTGHVIRWLLIDIHQPLSA